MTQDLAAKEAGVAFVAAVVAAAWALVNGADVSPWRDIVDYHPLFGRECSFEMGEVRASCPQGLVEAILRNLLAARYKIKRQNIVHLFY